MHRFTYAFNNPNRFHDPTGRDGEDLTESEVEEFAQEIMDVHQDIAEHGLKVSRTFLKIAEVGVEFTPLWLLTSAGLAAKGDPEAKENLIWGLATLGVGATFHVVVKYGPKVLSRLRKSGVANKVDDLMRAGKKSKSIVVKEGRGSTKAVGQMVDKAPGEAKKQAERARLFHKGNPKGTIFHNGRLYHVVTGKHLTDTDEIFDVAEEFSKRSASDLEELSREAKQRLRAAATPATEARQAAKPKFHEATDPSRSNPTNSGVGLKPTQKDFNKVLRTTLGPPPANMPDPHAHHNLFKKGTGSAQQELVLEGQAILREYGIDPIYGAENLTWAPNRIKGQHDIESLERVVETLRDVRDSGGEYDDIVEALRRLGQLAADRR